MEYRKYGETYYIRFDMDDEIISAIFKICKEEGIKSVTYSGIGGCGKAKIPQDMVFLLCIYMGCPLILDFIGKNIQSFLKLV